MMLDIGAGTGAPVVYLADGANVDSDAPFILALAQRYRVLAPSQPAEGVAEFIRATTDGPVHVIAESAAAATGCWLAIREPSLVTSLVLVTPTAPDADLTERLGEITPPTLVLWGTADEVLPPEAGQLFLQRIPNSYRILIYGATHSLPASACSKFVELVTDFFERGDRFVVAEPA